MQDLLPSSHGFVGGKLVHPAVLLPLFTAHPHLGASGGIDLRTIAANLLQEPIETDGGGQEVA